MRRFIVISFLASVLAFPALVEGEPDVSSLKPRDLTPVTWLKAPNHAPVEVVRNGKKRAVVYVADAKALKEIPQEGKKSFGTPPALRRLIDELIDVVRIRTGATLELVEEPPAANQPAIVIGDCEAARKAGIDTAKLPLEGFVVKTALNRVFLVGDGKADNSTTWAVADFLERFAGVRWYWPAEYGGRSIPRDASLIIPPSHYRDQPVFGLRNHYIDHPGMFAVHSEGHNRGDQMPLPFPQGVVLDKDKAGLAPDRRHTSDLALIRHGRSLDYDTGLIQGHAGMWGGLGALKGAGTRSKRWVCYSAQATLDAYLDRLSKHWDSDPLLVWQHKIITEISCTVYFPNSPGMPCRCPVCTRTASRYRDDAELKTALVAKHGDRRAFEIVEERVHIQVFGLFVQRLCEAVKRRWPDKTIVFRSANLPPPDDLKFSDNLRVDAVWPANWWSLGVEMHPSLGRGFEKRIRAWGVPVVTEGSASSPSDWTYGPVEYPHLVQDFYSRNRDCLRGSTLSIFCGKISVSNAPTSYVWRRVLWNPDLDVDATLDELCRRLFGSGAGPARELLRLECDRWEKTPLPRPLTAEDRHKDQSPGPRGTGTLVQEFRLPDDLYREIWPADIVARMKALRDQAFKQIEASGDKHALQAFLYWTWTFDAFLEEAAAVHRKLPVSSVREEGKVSFEATDGLPADLALNLGEGVEVKLVLIRPGEFMMGSQTNSWGHHRNESPQHRVRVTKPFYMGIHEVTEAQYSAVTGSSPSRGGKDRPVGGVSWNDAMDFCSKLSKKTGKSVRLPTEAEWEYACRAGTTTLWSFGDNEGDLDKYAWYAHKRLKDETTRDVGGKKPNPWGLYDMYGNVREWCLDRFAADFYKWAPTDNPSGPETGMFRVLRGGSAYNLLFGRNAELARSARRAYGHPDIRNKEVGFRMVVETDGGQK
ncbi:MAG: SUMF1/EgtB/PvdO family nonheme iron enzyme [Planctomycetota bacterium]|jgi:formylglycine-generating enzyme required for sulfatase activity|nr:SUMF1/EgtB/PvdO family nonheme iron enzyme [Planctomycetota bacterium]